MAIKDKRTGETQIFCLSWRNKKVFLFSENLKLLQTFSLPNGITEGWGLTSVNNYGENNQTLLILSDGSEKIYLIEPQQFKIVTTI